MFGKYNLKCLPKICTFLPKWRNLAKSGHTGREAGLGLSNLDLEPFLTDGYLIELPGIIILDKTSN